MFNSDMLLQIVVFIQLKKLVHGILYLVGVYGQYCTHITGNILFHSVPYLSRGNNASLEYWQYDRLGTTASAGCIRLTTADAQWIYYNCRNGTKVEFYNSSNPGPLGKPSAKKISSEASPYKNWDPTDPNPNNPWRNKSATAQNSTKQKVNQETKKETAQEQKQATNVTKQENTSTQNTNNSSVTITSVKNTTSNNTTVNNSSTNSNVTNKTTPNNTTVNNSNNKANTTKNETNTTNLNNTTNTSNTSDTSKNTNNTKTPGNTVTTSSK